MACIKLDNNPVTCSDSYKEDQLLITSVRVKNSKNASELANSSYENTMLDTNIKLNNSSSTITYQVTVYNGTNDNYHYVRTLEEDYSNDDIEYEISIPQDTVLSANSELTFNVTFRYKNNITITDDELESTLEFIFMKPHPVTYTNITGTYPAYAYEEEAFEIDFTGTLYNNLQIYQDGTLLSPVINYTFDNMVLNIPQVTGDLEIVRKATFKDTILANNPLGTGTPDFSKTSCSSGCGEATNGLYQTVDDYGTTYYFRGTVNNNFVKFGKNAFNEDLYWRIIRINGDGSVRLIYNGTSVSQTGFSTQIGTSAYNSTTNDSAYVGYTYNLGQTNDSDSTIKGVIDNWYNTTLKVKKDTDNNLYSAYLSDTMFCNDRSIYSNNGTYIYYYPYQRVSTLKSPSLECPNQSDQYTVNVDNEHSLGNGKLTNPVGLITADEVAYAGGASSSTNSLYYLNTNQYYWTMSPYSFSANNAHAYVWLVYSSGYLYNYYSTTANGVRPVINLSSEVLYKSGSGASDNPYEVSLE